MRCCATEGGGDRGSTTNINAGRCMLLRTKTVFINFLLKRNLNHVERVAKHER